MATKETLSPGDRLKNVFLAMVVLGGINVPREFRQNKEPTSPSKAKGTTAYAFYPPVNNRREIGDPPPLPTAGPRPVPTATPTPTVVPQEVSREKVEKIQPPEQVDKIRRPVYRGDPDQKGVALTFDDGFSAQAIQTTLEVLKANNIKGTFFVIGSQLQAYPDLWRQAVADGHEVCNHTYSHTYLSSLSGEAIKNELARWEGAAREVLGEDYVARMKKNFPYVRFPGGAGHNDEAVLIVMVEAGYWPIAWSVETYAAVLKKYKNLNTDPVAPIAQEVTAHIVNSARKGSIILLHFNAWDTLYLEATIRGIMDKGLQPTTVSGVLR